MPTNLTRVTLLGFGEVGQMLADEMNKRGAVAISVYDIAFDQSGSAQLAATEGANVLVAPSPGNAVRDAQVVISAVTAGAALDAAKSIAADVQRDAYIVDVNSVAPSTKRAIADAFAGRGRYVEAAVMAPVSGKRLQTPILLGGPDARDAESLLDGLGFAARFYSPEVGRASSVKMCRSIMVKGIEALMMECMMASDRYGVTDDVLASLADMFPDRDMHKFAGYLMSRTLHHGRRRAEEMLEVAMTVEHVGLSATMTRPTAAMQAWSARIAIGTDPAILARADLADMLEIVSQAGEMSAPSPAKAAAQ